MKQRTMPISPFRDLRGMPPKEISVKNLANIIQARMSEILDFVSYHLKQVGLEEPHAEWWYRVNWWRFTIETPDPAYRICHRIKCKDRFSE